MANIEYQWLKTDEPIRISEYANDLGFNLRTLDRTNFSNDIRAKIDEKIRNSIISYLDYCWNENSEGLLADVSQGVYVITLADNLSVDYNGYPSKVIYIGRGKIRDRIKAHLAIWIKDFSDSLQDIAFDVWMAEVRVNGSKDAYKEVESDLINYFWNKFNCLPLQNSIAGQYHEKEHNYPNDWNLPLKNPSNIQNGWSIKPLKNNPWAMKFDDE